MPPRIELEHQRDFTGGLNIAVDPYDLEPNETFACVNVDIGRAGGFQLRRGSRRWIDTTTGLTADVDSLYTYTDSSGVQHLLAAGRGQVRRWDGAAWQAVQAAVADGTTSFVEMNGDLYIVHESRNITRWTGAGASAAIVAAGYNDNLGAPADNRMVMGTCAAVHNGVLFVANINDSLDAAVHPSRIRWSHPGKPRDWRTNDWIDIDPDDGSGGINALVPMGDRLIIFKDRAIYALHGFPPEGFSVTNLTHEIGTPSTQSVSATEEVVYFWDAKRGAYELTSTQVKWIFRSLYPYIDENFIDKNGSDDVVCQVHDDRVWYSVPWLEEPYANTTVGLIYAPNVGKQGAWTFHDLALVAYHEHLATNNSDTNLLAGDGLFVMELDVDNYYLDEDTAGAESMIRGSYTTRWFDASKNAALKKRWKRPVVVVSRNAEQEFKVDVFSDYDPTTVKRTFSMFTTLDVDEGIWDVDDWDDVMWAGEYGEAAIVLRGSPLSGGVAKALRFSNVTSGVNWHIHGLTMKWVPKRIRN